jgi:hypothetical protein
MRDIRLAPQQNLRVQGIALVLLVLVPATIVLLWPASPAALSCWSAL